MSNRYRHRKGGTYVAHTLIARVQTDTPLTDYAQVTVYASEADGSIWVRPVSEFNDGRFVMIPDLTRWERLTAWWHRVNPFFDEPVRVPFVAQQGMPRMSATPPPSPLPPVNSQKVMAIVKELQKARGEWMLSDFTIADRILTALNEEGLDNG